MGEKVYKILEPFFPILKPIHRQIMIRWHALWGFSIRPTNYLRAFMRTSMVPLFSSDNIRNTPDVEYSKVLRERGFVTLQNVFNPEMIRGIQKKFDAVIKNNAFVLSSEYARNIDGEAGTSKIMPEVVSLIKNDEILKVLHSFYKSYFRLYYISATRLFSLTEEQRKSVNLQSGYWHCDDNPPDLVHLVVYLQDVTKEDGPTHLHTKQRTKDLMRLGYYKRWEYGLKEEELEGEQWVTQLTGSIGTAHFMIAPRCLHRAGIPAMGHTRDSFIISFRPGLEPNLIKQLQPHWRKKAYLFLDWLSEDQNTPGSAFLRGKDLVYGPSPDLDNTNKLVGSSI